MQTQQLACADMFARAPCARTRTRTRTRKVASECTQNMLPHTDVPLFLLREPPGLASEDRVASARARGTARGSWLPHKPAAVGTLARVATTAAPKPAESVCVAPLTSCRTTMPLASKQGARQKVRIQCTSHWQDGTLWPQGVSRRRCQQGTMPSTRYPTPRPSPWFFRAGGHHRAAAARSR